MELPEILKHYGPLALGWVCAWILWQELKKHLERYHEEKERDIEAKADMLNALQKLTDTIEQ